MSGTNYITSDVGIVWGTPPLIIQYDWWGGVGGEGGGGVV